MAGIAAATELLSYNVEIEILEQNYLPGGCSSSYYRQGYIFETGATTLIGIGENMPLSYLLQKSSVHLDLKKLEIPMKVILSDGTEIIRYKELDRWIEEAEKVFGKKNQAQFWKKMFELNNFVWKNAQNQFYFPPQNLNDLWKTFAGLQLDQFKKLPYFFISVFDYIKKLELDQNALFLSFINEQLMITAQNHSKEVNLIFGAASLCYTLVDNYYVYGGMIQLIKPFCSYLEENKVSIQLREKVDNFEKVGQKWMVKTNKGMKEADAIIAAIPLNNLENLTTNKSVLHFLQKRKMPAEKLNSAFQLSIAFQTERIIPVLHQQIHLDTKLSGLESDSIFVSVSDEIDWYRAALGTRVASVSTHLKNIHVENGIDKGLIETELLAFLDRKNIILKNEIQYVHSSSKQAWEQWTERKHGAVGGYPQWMNIKPWQLVPSRLIKNELYLCGDTSYPGQGIPGVCLSGIIAAKKMSMDLKLKINKRLYS